MGKSITDVAKGILMKESNDSSPDRDAKKKTANASTLSPKSKLSEPDPKHNEADELGGPIDSVHSSLDLGAKASAKIGKDKSKSAQKSAGEPIHKLSEEEELNGIIAGLMEEGLSDQEIYDLLSESDDCDEDDDKDDKDSSLTS